MATTLRKRVEVYSAPTLLRIHALPRAIVPVVLVALMLVGLMSSNVVGGLALLFVAAFVGWLLYLSWPLLEARPRVLRAATVFLVVLAALSKFVGQ